MLITKMHSYGNDYCILLYDDKTDYKKLSKKICDRILGIGALGLIVIKLKPELEMLLYDDLGNRKAMDLNALLCFSKYIFDNKLIRKNNFNVIFSNAIYNIEKENSEFILNMGAPNYNNAMLHINDSIDSFGRVLKIDDANITFYSLYLGDIHTIIIVDDFNLDVINKKDLIINNKLFEAKTNLHYVKIIDKNNIELNSFDKNCNYLLSSVGGAAAALIVLNKLRLVYKNITVNFKYGNIKAEIKKDKIYVKGNALKIFECEFKEEI